MTFSIGHVQNGTGAGWRRMRPKATFIWRCECPFPNEMVAPTLDGGEPVRVQHATHKLNPGYLKKCIDCGTARDQ